MKNVQVSLVGERPGGAVQGLRVPPAFDHLVLLHGDSEKSLAAAHKVRAVAGELIPLSEIELRKIDPFGMADVLYNVIQVRKSHPDADITVNVTGGTNIMASAALVGCFVLGADAIYIKEARGDPPAPFEERVIRLPVPKVVLEDVKGSKIRILQCLAGSRGSSLSKTQSQLGRELQMSPQLVSSHVRKLQSWRLVTVQLTGRTKLVEPTDAGRLFAQLAR